MEEKMLNIKINGIETTVPYGTKIIDAARKVGIEIPTLCYLKEINEIGACRFCLVEVKGARGPVPACVYPIERDGTEIFTNTESIRKALFSPLSGLFIGVLRSTSCILIFTSIVMSIVNLGDLRSFKKIGKQLFSDFFLFLLFRSPRFGSPEKPSDRSRLSQRARDSTCRQAP